MKKKIILLFKVIISISIIYIILNNVDWKIIENNISKVSFSFIAIVFFLNIIERAELTLKWHLLIKIKNIYISFIKLFYINLVGGFLGLLLPSSLGTDIIRGYYLTKHDSNKLSIISSVFIDRILGVLSLLLLGGISLLNVDLIESNSYRFLIIICVLFPFLILFLLQKESINKYLDRISRKIKNKKIVDLLVNLNSSIVDYRNHPISVFYSFSLSLLVQFTRVFTYYIIALAFNIHYPIIYFLLLVPIIMLVIMLPISIGGLGVKEGTFIAFFSMVGMSVENAVLISLTNTIINTLVTLLGGIVYIFYKPLLISNNNN